MLTRWNSQKSLVKIGYERVITSRFPEGSKQPAASGSCLNRRYRVKYEHQTWLERALLSDPIPGTDPVPDDPAPVGEGLPWDITPEQKMQLKGVSMSVRSAERIRTKIHAMYAAGIAKTFVTLTFVNSVTDRDALRCFQKLLKLWRDQWGKFNFLWVVERQQSGNVHFHVVLDRIIDVQRENKRWALLQYNSGVIYSTDCIRRKKKDHLKISAALGAMIKEIIPDRKNDDCQYYKLQSSVIVEPEKMNPAQLAFWLNPLDVVKVNSSHSLALYLASYVTKNIGEKFHCRVWHCSRGVSELFTSMMCGADMHREFIKQVPGVGNTYVYKKDIVDKRGRVVVKSGTVIFPKDCNNDYCSWVYIVNRVFAEKYINVIAAINRRVLAGEISSSDIIWYTYEDYARNYLQLDDFHYTEFNRVRNNYFDQDARGMNQIRRRGLNWENDFYQISKALGGAGDLSVYCDNPTFDKRGNRYYRGKQFSTGTILNLQLNTKNYVFNN